MSSKQQQQQQLHQLHHNHYNFNHIRGIVIVTQSAKRRKWILCILFSITSATCCGRTDHFIFFFFIFWGITKLMSIIIIMPWRRAKVFVLQCTQATFLSPSHHMDMFLALSCYIPRQSALFEISFWLELTFVLHNHYLNRSRLTGHWTLTLVTDSVCGGMVNTYAALIHKITCVSPSKKR